MYYKDKLYPDLDYFILINLITFWPEINSPVFYFIFSGWFSIDLKSHIRVQGCQKILMIIGNAVFRKSSKHMICEPALILKINPFMVEFLSLKLIYSQKGVNTASFLDYKVAKAFASLRPSEYFWGFTWQPSSNSMGSQSPSDFIWPKFNNSLFIFLDDIGISTSAKKSSFTPSSWHICTIYNTSHQYLNRQHSKYAFKLKVSCFNCIFLHAIESTMCCTTLCCFPGPWDKPLLSKVPESENHCLKRKKVACTKPISLSYYTDDDYKLCIQ